MVKIDGYSEIKIIHEGRKHLVIKACRVDSGKVVMLKTTSNILQTSGELGNLKKEFGILNNLDVAYVPKVFGLVDVGQKLMIEMEYIDLPTLKELVDRGHILLVEALLIFEKVVEVLDQIHKAGFVHRDINPNNILWDSSKKELYLIDFGSALEMNKNIRIAPSVIEGTHAYMSPEQTGRTNQNLDYRTDYYSTGIMMYEVLAGKLPYVTKDINEMIHFHMAVEPVGLNKVNSKIPRVVSEIVLKCIAKSPNLRYQSGEGLIEDLRQCSLQLKETGVIEGFELGTKDILDHFEIQEKIYGRAEELTKLKIFYNEGKEEDSLVLVMGLSGVGKTFINQEFGQWIKEQDGNTVYGKYDQYSRNIPYSAVIQAFSRFVSQILSLDDKAVFGWREKILEAVGINGQIITRVIPELELLIGKQEDLPERDAIESKTRFNSVFYDFIKVFGDIDRPLAIFLDDLQWIDVSSIRLLETFLLSRGNSGILFICSYRDNEVFKTHSLEVALTSLKAKDALIKELHLETLTPLAISEILMDSLLVSENEILELRDVIYTKTKGNPLFVKNILISLYEDGKISYNYTSKKWSWELETIDATRFSDDVIEILTSRIKQLPDQTIEMLKLAACIGNKFRVQQICEYFDLNLEQVMESMNYAINSGLIQQSRVNGIVDLEETVANMDQSLLSFAHDQIHKASYSMLSDQAKSEIHLKLGRNMMKEDLHHTIFDIVYQFSNAISLVKESEERQKLVQVFLRAGKKAKDSVAFEYAAKTLESAKQLLSETIWSEDYNLALEINLELLEACYLTFAYDQADNLNVEVKKHVKTDADLLRLYKLLSKQYHQQMKYQEAIDINYQGLALLGIDFPRESEKLMEYFALEKEKIDHILQKKSPSSFLNMVENNEKSYIMVLEFLLNLYADSYLVGNEAVLAASSALMARLAMEEGNNQYTSIAFVYYASTLCAIGIEYREAHTIGTLAIDLAEKYEVQTLQNYTYHIFCLAVNHWLKPLQSSYDYWLKASKLNLASGSPYSGYVHLQLAHVLFAKGAPFEEVQQQIHKTRDFLITMGHEGTIILLKVIVEQALKCFRGETDAIYSLDDASFNTEEYMNTFGVYPFFKGSYYYTMLRITYIMGKDLSLETLQDYIAVIAASQQGQIILADSYMYYVLHLINNIDNVEGVEKEHYEQLIETGINMMFEWSELCEANFKHKYLLLKAEFEKGKSELCELIEWYDESIDRALKEKFIHDAALASEKAGEFWFKKGKSHLAKPYFEKAYTLYERWGAKTKLAQLKVMYRDLLKTVIESSTMSDSYFTESTDSLVNTSSFSDKLDFLSVIKASQAISKHMDISTLTEQLTSIAVENAGATKGILILEEQNEFVIKAIVIKKVEEVISVNNDIPYVLSNELSHAVVNYAINTKKDVVLDYAYEDVQFSDCPYIKKNKIASVCCLPIVQKDAIRGLIYLENANVTAAFKNDRIKIIHILSTQATISMDNARVYTELDKLNKNLEEKVKERTVELYEKNELLKITNIELERLSTTDQLTGIFNRRYIEDKIEKEISVCNRYKKVMGVILLDVDHFKQVNDTYGHGIGDLVLIRIVEVLNLNIRKTDSLGRWGGEEFLITVPEAESILEFSEKLKNAVANTIHDEVGSVTVSMGVTIYKEHDTPSTLLSRADIALYKAKENGRNRVEVN